MAFKIFLQKNVLSQMPMQFVPHCVCSYLPHVPPEVMLHMHCSTTTNLEIVLPILKKCTKKVHRERVN